MERERGKWPAYNVKAIVNNVESVFKNKDISKLNKPTYIFITQHMGFIAHYDLGGFQSTYEDLREFVLALQTSEYGRDIDYNIHQAARQETDRQFDEWYGAVYNKSIAAATRGIVGVARKYQCSVVDKFNSMQKDAEIAEITRLATKHNIKIGV